MDDQQVPTVLRKRLENKLGIQTRGLYKRIARIAREQVVSSRAAAFLLASELGVSYSQWATAADRGEMRGHSSVMDASAKSEPTPPAERNRPIARRQKAVPAKRIKDNTVFVVHGRDNKLNESMFGFLRALGLKPKEWLQVLNAAKGANPNVGEAIHNAMENAQGVVVMFSPDEQSKLKVKLASPKDKKARLHELQEQARPNVIFEAGLALGAHAQKTVLVQIGDTREISDIAGRHMAYLSNSPESRIDFAGRLTKLGFTVDTTGTSWLSKSFDFER